VIICRRSQETLRPLAQALVLVPIPEAPTKTKAAQSDIGSLKRIVVIVFIPVRVTVTAEDTRSTNHAKTAAGQERSTSDFFPHATNGTPNVEYARPKVTNGLTTIVTVC
jgi:hypothetical protein